MPVNKKLEAALISVGLVLGAGGVYYISKDQVDASADRPSVKIKCEVINLCASLDAGQKRIATIDLETVAGEDGSPLIPTDIAADVGPCVQPVVDFESSCKVLDSECKDCGEKIESKEITDDCFCWDGKDPCVANSRDAGLMQITAGNTYKNASGLGCIAKPCVERESGQSWPKECPR